MDEMGFVKVNFPDVPTGYYYIGVQHRNSVRTWSSHRVAVAYAYTGSIGLDSTENDLTDNVIINGGANQTNAGIQSWMADIEYDFTASDTMAYYDNQVLKGNSWCIYSGDVNQDGSVDISDMVIADYQSTNFCDGYCSADVDGNETVDISDMIIIEANNDAFAGECMPPELQ